MKKIFIISVLSVTAILVLSSFFLVKMNTDEITVGSAKSFTFENNIIYSTYKKGDEAPKDWCVVTPYTEYTLKIERDLVECNGVLYPNGPGDVFVKFEFEDIETSDTTIDFSNMPWQDHTKTWDQFLEDWRKQ